MLKYNDDDQENGVEECPEQPMQGEEIELTGNKVNNNYYNYSCQHLHSSCSPNEEDNSINYNGEYHYVDYILPSKGAEKVKHECGAEKIPD